MKCEESKEENLRKMEEGEFGDWKRIVCRFGPRCRFEVSGDFDKDSRKLLGHLLGGQIDLNKGKLERKEDDLGRQSR